MLLVRPRDTVTTYRCLRIAMPALVVLLAVSLADQVFSPDPNCWLGSISAYYYTASRPAFVASLTAIGACLVIYAGNTPREDFVLNVSGVLAFAVAFVPTPLTRLSIDPDQPSCQRSNVPTGAQLTAAVDNNMLALLVTATVVLVIAYAFRLTGDGSPRPSVALVLMAMLIAVAWVLYVVDRGLIRDEAHLAASVGMFGGIMAVVLLNALPRPRLDPQAVPAPPAYRRTYLVLFVVMAVSGTVFAVIAWSGRFEHTVFWLESVLTGLFAVFWIVQSKELWLVASRASAAQAAVGSDDGAGQPVRNESAG
jgi:hypothetical protein